VASNAPAEELPANGKVWAAMKTTLSLSRRFTSICAGLAIGLLAACATTVHLNDSNATVGSYKYGYLFLKPNQPLETVHAAVKKAFKDLGYLQTADDVSPGDITVKGTDQHETAVSVNLKDYTTFTEVKIRAGVSGDLSQEQEVYQAIEKNF
jgi:hypothetical protein